MKPHAHKRRRLIVRIKPGGFVRIPLPFLRHSGWQPGDVIICEADDGHIRLFKPPSIIAWRVERLRRRLSPGNADDSLRFSARNYAEFRRMSKAGPGAHAMHIRGSQR